MTEIEKELERFIASGKATTKVNSGRFQTTLIDPLKIAKHFAQWDREQMMKDAIDGWVARDECGDIAIFSDKPHRDLGLGMWTPARHAFLFPRKDEYPDVTWNSEPQKVKVIIIKE